MLYGSGKYTYELVEDWAKLPKGWSLNDVSRIAIDNQDRVYAMTRSDHPIMVFDREGNFLSTYGEGHFKRAHGLTRGPDGSLYCTDDRNQTVFKFSSDGELLMTLGTKGESSSTGYRDVLSTFERISSITRGGPPFNRPTGVALSSSGEIFVSDGYGNARVHKFSADGELLLSWGEPGPDPGQFRLPHAIWLDNQDRVWVLDRENSRIQIFNTRGELLTQWTDLIRPLDIFIDNKEDTVYCSELCKRVSIFTIDGKLLTRWGNEKHEEESPLFITPHAIAVDSKGDLYIGEASIANIGTDRGIRMIQKFTRRR